MADGDVPTTEQCLRSKIRRLEERVRNQAWELRRLEVLLVERKAALNLLGIAWSTRGAETRAGELAREEVDQLVRMVNRIHLRHTNTEYRVGYKTLDETVKARMDSVQRGWNEALTMQSTWYRRAKRWKALAKKLRRASLDRSADR